MLYECVQLLTLCLSIIPRLQFAFATKQTPLTLHDVSVSDFNLSNLHGTCYRVITLKYTANVPHAFGLFPFRHQDLHMRQKIVFGPGWTKLVLILTNGSRHTFLCSSPRRLDKCQCPCGGSKHAKLWIAQRRQRYLTDETNPGSNPRLRPVHCQEVPRDFLKYARDFIFDHFLRFFRLTL